jgi:hypothetical protein
MMNGFNTKPMSFVRSLSIRGSLDFTMMKYGIV